MAGSALLGCAGAKDLQVKLRRRLLLECKRQERVPAALRAAVRAAASSHVEELRAKRAALATDDAEAKRFKDAFAQAQLKLKTAQHEDRTAHRRLLAHKGTVQTARAIAAEAQAAERAKAKRVRCGYALWLYRLLIRMLESANEVALAKGGGRNG